MSKKDKANQPKKAIEQIVRNGKCLRCGHALGKNMQSCVSCRKKLRLQKKANKRGKDKNTYL